MQGPIPDVKLAAIGLMDFYRRFVCDPSSQLDSGESCIVLQSGPTRSLVATFPPRSVVTCSMRILCHRGRTLQTRPRTGVCEPLMPDVVSPKVHQNNCSYVSSADLPLDSLRENLACWAVTRRTLKNHKTVKMWGVGACSGQYGICIRYTKCWFQIVAIIEVFYC